MDDPVWISTGAAVVSSIGTIGALVFSIVTYRSKKKAEARANKLEAENESLKSDWIPMHRALRYLALDAAWGRTANDTDGLALEERLGRELLEALSRGEVEARGRKVFSRRPTKLANASQPISQSFWQYAFIQPFGEIVINEDARNAATTSGEFPISDPQEYREVSIRRSDVLRRWTKARDAKRHNSPYYEALKGYWRNGGSHSDHLKDLDMRQTILQNIRTDC